MNTSSCSHWPGLTRWASPSFSRTACTNPLRCLCLKRSSLRGRQRSPSSRVMMGHPEEEPFWSRNRASWTAAGASGRTCIRNSWGRSLRNTCRGVVVLGCAWAARPSLGGDGYQGNAVGEATGSWHGLTVFSWTQNLGSKLSRPPGSPEHFFRQTDSYPSPHARIV